MGPWQLPSLLERVLAEVKPVRVLDLERCISFPHGPETARGFGGVKSSVCLHHRADEGLVLPHPHRPTPLPVPRHPTGRVRRPCRSVWMRSAGSCAARRAATPASGRTQRRPRSNSSRWPVRAAAVGPGGQCRVRGLHAGPAPLPVLKLSGLGLLGEGSTDILTAPQKVKE